jgi:Plasmid pRiA4b ORF-3-like protein
MTAKTDIVRLKITLDEVKPVVMRRLTVRVGIRLDHLHKVIQAAMGWTNSHLWEFRAGGTGWGPRDPDGGFGDSPHDASKATLLDVLTDVGGKSLKYLYDFGDGWEHTIKAERIFAGVPGLEQPFLLEATGRCPPEDVGGPWGYMELLEAIADPHHERHKELTDWHDTDFDPKVANVRHIEAAIAAIARRSTRHPSKKPRKTL